jgi:hypothetical protein
VLAAGCMNQRLYLAPEHLRDNVLLVAGLAALLGERLSLVVEAERAEGASELRRNGRERAAGVPLLRERAHRPQGLSGPFVVAGQDRGVPRRTVGWSFDGHIGTNCATAHCSGHTGAYVETVWTQGSFHACLTWYCVHKYPRVTITVYADGTASYSTAE